MCNYPTKFPCKIFAKNVSENVKAVQCDLCELWVHIKCNNLNYLDSRYLQNSNESWYCIECCSAIFPFHSLSRNKNFLACCTNTDNNITQWIDYHNNHNNSLFPKPSSNLDLLVNQFNNVAPENNNDPEKICSSKYYDIEEMGDIEISHKNKSLSLFHINACSLTKNFDGLQLLVSCTKTKFESSQVNFFSNIRIYIHKKIHFSIAEINTQIKTTAIAVIKNELRYFLMSEGNTCIAEPKLEVLPFI